MDEPSTVLDPSLPSAVPGSTPTRTALVVVWSRHAPERVGEVVFVPDPRGGAKSLVFGRGAAREGDTDVRAPLIRQRPGRNRPCPPWSARGISRRQLVLGWGEDGPEVENVGRCKLMADDFAVERARLSPGKLLHLRGQLSFLVTERPIAFDDGAAFDEDDAEEFGRADRFGMVGESAPQWELRERVAFAAKRQLHTLLHGETGTGKEVAAQAIHALSARGGRAWVSRNAATIPPGLVDAELFGNIRDYPNPGMKERPGLIGSADGGSLFLDEIGELPTEQQAHLLRVLDESGEYHRLGESTARRSDLRLVGATNRDPSQLKHDLLARMPLQIRVPALRERLEDVPLLLSHLLRGAARDDRALQEQFCEPSGGRVDRIAPAVVHHALRAQLDHNVRGLRTLLWRCIAQSRGDWVELDPALLEQSEALAEEPSAPGEISEEALRASLRRHDGVIERVWRELGLRNRHVLRRLLKRYDIDPKNVG